MRAACGERAAASAYLLDHAKREFVGRDGQSAWMYGNVYDPADGETPLNWWLDLLKPE